MGLACVPSETSHRKPSMPWLRGARLGRPWPNVLSGPRFRRFGLSEHQNRLDGSPWSEPRNPPRDIGAEILVLGTKALSQHWLLVGQDKGVEREPHEPAI